MLSAKSLFIAISTVVLTVSKANAFTGRATWDSLGTTPCPVQCTPLTDFRVALPVDLFPNGEHCCEKVQVTYQGTSLDVTFTDLFLAGQGSFNISLSNQAFAELAPLELDQISPVTWNFV
ncbi:hypothetical protein BDQ12DRAFT_684778 [Crucibulum laeve]|uniref:Pherophorin domain-containing protein n=1 Tax=Crucibulum laeve TaxID=68775 RepID=A0A5C3M150_9AGAR|nr:hypothetical protein BDQ12DRAFT_684778 [Crucibulum laeve]